MIVTFGPVKFWGNFSGDISEPEYSDLFLQACFNCVAMQISNDTGSSIRDGPREGILYLTTAHIATIGRRDPNLVGQIVSAGQGTPVCLYSLLWLSVAKPGGSKVTDRQSHLPDPSDKGDVLHLKIRGHYRPYHQDYHAPKKLLSQNL